MRRSMFVGGWAVGLLLAIVSCSNNSSTGPGITSIRVTPDSLHLNVGQYGGLVATALDASGNPVTGAAVVFASTDSTIASVTPAGLVRGVHSGQAAIRVTSGGHETDVVVLVSAVGASVGITPADTTVPEGGSYNLVVVVYDSAHAPIVGAPVVFSTSDSTVAKVNAVGHVTAVGSGSASLIAASGAVFNVATVEVKDTLIVGHTLLAGSPFGDAATKTGVVYVLRHSVNTASRFNLPDTTVRASLGVGGNPTAVAFDSGGVQAFVTAQFADMVQIIDVASNTVVDSFATTGDPFVVRVSPDDKTIFVSTNVDTLYQVDRATKAVVAAYPLRAVNGLAFSPTNDSMVYASALDSGKVVEINYQRKTIGRTFHPGGVVQGVAITSDGTTLYVANETNAEIDGYDLISGGGAGAVTTPDGAPFDLALSADGNTIWVTLSGVGEVQGYSRASLTLTRKINTGGTPRRIAVSPGNPIVVANESGWVDFIK